MKHFIKLEPGALRSQGPAYCQSCSKKIDRTSDYFMVEAHWKVKRKADKLYFCSTKCITKWTKP